MDFDEAVQNSKKWDNYSYIFFIQKPTFLRFIPSFFRVLKGQWRKFNVTTPNSAENEILYNNFLLPQREDTEGNVTLDFLHRPFKTLKKEGINLRNVGFWIKKIVISISLFWILDCLIKIHSIHLSVRLQKLLEVTFISDIGRYAWVFFQNL